MSSTGSPDYEETVEVNGREYQRFAVDNRLYFVPVDERENARLASQNHLFFYLLGGQWFMPEIEYPGRILECGYGEGSWARSVAEHFEDSKVVAFDIHFPDVSDTSENLEFQHVDLNQRLRSESSEDRFDLIHSRCVGPGIKKARWDGYISDLRRLLRRDGWAQLTEYYYNFQSRSGRLTDQHQLWTWGQTYRTIMDQHLDRNPRIGPRLEGKMRAAGFRNVQARRIEMPIGAWPNDPTQRWLGSENVANIIEMLESHAMWPFTQVEAGGRTWSPEQVGWLKDWASREIQEQSTELKLYIEV